MNPDEDIPLPALHDEQDDSQLVSDELERPSIFTCPETMKTSVNEKYCYAISYWFHFKYLEYQYLRHGFSLLPVDFRSISGRFPVVFWSFYGFKIVQFRTDLP